MHGAVLIVEIIIAIFVRKSFEFQPFTVRNHILARGTKFRALTTDWYGCLASCSQDTKCTSYNYWFFKNDVGSSTGTCELNRCGISANCGQDRKLVFQNEAVYQQLRESKEDCNVTLKAAPASCADVRKLSNASGLYMITPAPGYTVPVFCDQSTDGGGWTVIQRRINGSVNFFRDWKEYKQGFGVLEKEFWLGLDVIHALTTREPNKIRIDLKDCNMTTAHAQYKSFQIAEESENYRLLLGGYEKGDAGDSFTFQNNMNFTTFDRDNDGLEDKNCAKMFKGAWWYKNCHYSNLNGEYKCGPHATFADGMTWKTWKGFYYSVKETEMKIRPVDYEP